MAEETQVNTTMAKDKMVVNSAQSNETVTQSADSMSSKSSLDLNSAHTSSTNAANEQAPAHSQAAPQQFQQSQQSQQSKQDAVIDATDSTASVKAQPTSAKVGTKIGSKAGSKSIAKDESKVKSKVETKLEPKLTSNFETSELVRATEQPILMSEQQGYTFGGTQSFSLRQLWPLKAYNYSFRRRDPSGKIVYKNKDAILELGVGINMTTSIQYWAKAINVLDANSRVTPFAMQLFGTNDAPGLDPYLEKIDSIWLFHYFMCSNPSTFTAAWFLFNRFNHQYFDKALALEELQRFVLDEYNLGHIKQLISANTLEKDIAVVIKSYAPLTHDVGVLRKSVKRLDNNEELSDTPLRELNLMSSNVKETQFNVGSHANLSPYVFAFCLLDFFMRSQGRLVTMDFNKIAYSEGSVGRIFKLDEMALDEYLQQLESITQGTLFFTEQNGLRQLVCPVEHSARPALLKQFLARIYNHAA